MNANQIVKRRLEGEEEDPREFLLSMPPSDPPVVQRVLATLDAMLRSYNIKNMSFKYSPAECNLDHYGMLWPKPKVSWITFTVFRSGVAIGWLSKKHDATGFSYWSASLYSVSSPMRCSRLGDTIEWLNEKAKMYAD